MQTQVDDDTRAVVFLYKLVRHTRLVPRSSAL